MNQVRPIRNEEEYQEALDRVDRIFQAEPGTPEGDERDILTSLLESYENRRHPMAYPTITEAIRFRMEQQNLTERDLTPILGSPQKVRAILSGQARLTMSAARALNRHLHIPAEVLLQPEGSCTSSDQPRMGAFIQLPLRQMAREGWIEDRQPLQQHAADLAGDLIQRAGGPPAWAIIMNLGQQPGLNGASDQWAIRAWLLQALVQERSSGNEQEYLPIDGEFLRQVAQASAWPNGPQRALEILSRRGIGLQTPAIMPRMRLDTGAILVPGNRPVIAMTLRDDRIDHFWEQLLHALSHLWLHIPRRTGGVMLDDSSMRPIDPRQEDQKEREAGRLAQESLTPQGEWEQSGLDGSASVSRVLSAAHQMGIHPAVVAGRIRRETRNPRLLSQLIGREEIRKSLASRAAPEPAPASEKHGTASEK